MSIGKKIKAAVREIHKTATRSSHWSKVRSEHLKNNPSCAACGGKRMLQVHHIMPFHEVAALELEPTNLITLCLLKDCHVDIGHGGDYRHYNPDVVELCEKIRSGNLNLKTAAASAKTSRRLNDGDEST